MSRGEWSLAAAGEIADAAALARASGRLGIDTEFMSEGRYRALLCLVQIVVDDPIGRERDQDHLIDGLGDADVTPLAELLADPAVEIVLHAGRQDVAILRRAWAQSSRISLTHSSRQASRAPARRRATAT